MPEWFSILPPIFAIFLAIVTRQVVLSLFAGIWLGTFFIFDYRPITSFLEVINHFIKPALADPDHADIIIFTLMLGGVAGLITRNGGSAGLVNVVTRWATNPLRGQLTTFIMGLIIFFDDYANTLIVGNTMRPITDKLKVSREKLAYLVDSTAAPVATLSLSTWVGFQLGLIGDAVKGTGYTADPFSIFVRGIPYGFYPLLTLFFVLLVILSRHDFGEMARAEERARTTGKLLRDGAQPASDLTGSRDVLPSPDTPARWYNGFIPVLAVIVITIIGLLVTGSRVVSKEGLEPTLWNILANASSYQALLWSSLSACTIAILLSVAQRVLTIHEAMEAWFAGAKSMFLACLILVLAWSIGAVTKELKTAEFLVSILSDTMPAFWLPAATFVIASFVSFSTGTSWGTMAILMPLVVPLAWALNPTADWYLVASVSSVLSGSIFGDHCSPISDTTVMSSMTSACDHVDHVRTQLPYALLVAVVGLVVGLIPSGFGLSPLYLLPAASLALVGLLFVFGKRIDKN